MKRAIGAVVATVVGVVWLVTFRVTPHARPVAAAPPPSPAPATSETPSSAPAAPAATATPTPTPAPTNRPANGSFTGALVPTRFGDVQVRIVVTSGRITDVVAVQMPSDRARSAEITQYVTPVLRSEVIRAQNAQIDVISGATFTSEAYAESVNDAMRQDHLA
ncbi:MAG: FMN-binding protein [Chloroflexi bacterium]|nr:MAG: FMN-binding protein [Chloroflexota bacterium]